MRKLQPIYTLSILMQKYTCATENVVLEGPSVQPPRLHRSTFQGMVKCPCYSPVLVAASKQCTLLTGILDPQLKPHTLGQNFRNNGMPFMVIWRIVPRVPRAWVWSWPSLKLETVRRMSEDPDLGFGHGYCLVSDPCGTCLTSILASQNYT